MADALGILLPGELHLIGSLTVLEFAHPPRVDFHRCIVGQGQLQVEAFRWLAAAVGFHQQAVRGQFAHLQRAGLAATFEQRQGFVQVQAPGTRRRALFVDDRRRQLQVEAVQLVLADAQRKGHAEIAATGLERQLGSRGKLQQQLVGLGSPVDAKAGRSFAVAGATQHQLANERQLIFGQNRFIGHVDLLRWRSNRRMPGHDCKVPSLGLRVDLLC